MRALRTSAAARRRRRAGNGAALCGAGSDIRELRLALTVLLPAVRPAFRACLADRAPDQAVNEPLAARGFLAREDLRAAKIAGAPVAEWRGVNRGDTPADAVDLRISVGILLVRSARLLAGGCAHEREQRGGDEETAERKAKADEAHDGRIAPARNARQLARRAGKDDPSHERSPRPLSPNSTSRNAGAGRAKAAIRTFERT
jgi:hypothetical protein